MSTVELNRLNIIGKITIHTPKIVLEEVASAHGITIRSLVEETDSNSCLTVREPYKTGHLRAIARYVNTNCNWNRNSLLRSYEFLQQFIYDKCVIPSDKIDYGPQTPEKNYSYNACMVYKLIKVWGLRTNYDTTFDEMVNMINMYMMSKDVLISKIETIINTCEKQVLISMINESSKVLSVKNDILIQRVNYSDKISLESIKQVCESYTIENLLTRVIPSSITEAVVLCALNKKIDLSYCDDIMKEYTNKGQTLDPFMRNRLLCNPLIFNLNYYFNPYMPENIYNKEMLKNLVKYEGTTEEDIFISNLTNYEYLKNASFKTNIYHGIQINLESVETIIYHDEISKIKDMSRVVCIGTINKLFPTTYYELAQYWDNGHECLNPINGEVISRSIINKIYAIRRYSSEFNLSINAKNELNELIDVIRNNEAIKMSRYDLLNTFYDDYMKLDDGKKNLVILCLRQIFNMAMTMRGWDGKNSYPIEDAPVKEQTEIDISVSNEQYKLNQLCEQLCDDKDIILNLPLVIYRNGSFLPAAHVDIGITLADKLKIIAEGKGVNSCIRMCSNWLASSVYKYMIILRMDEPFDINKLKIIA